MTGGNPVPTNEHGSFNDYYRALLYELLWEKGSTVTTGLKAELGRIAISNWLLLGPSQARTGERPQRQWCGPPRGVGVELGEVMVFCGLGLVRGPQIIPKAPAKTGKRGWLLIF